MRKRKTVHYLQKEDDLVLESGGKWLGGFTILMLICVLIARQCESPRTTPQPAKETKIKTILTPDQESRIG